MRTLILTLVVGLAAVASGGHTALSAQTAIAINGTPFLVKGGEGQQVDSHLSGSLVVFAERSSAGSFIYYRDLADPGSALQTVPGDGSLDSLPDVAGTQIVFTRRISVTSRSLIVLFDTANPSLAPIELSPAPPGVRRQFPAIGGDTVAFEQYTTLSSGVNDVCVSSINDPLAPETCLTTDGTTVSNQHPAVSPDGNTVVWEKCASPGVACDIYIADRNEEGAWGAPRFLVDTGGSDLTADTNGRFVTWTSTDALDNSFYYMEITGTAGPQLIGSTDGGYASISGDFVVFQQLPAAGTTYPNLSVLDLATGRTYSLGGTSDVARILPDISHDPSGNAWITWTTWDPNSSSPSDTLDVWAMSLDLETPAYTVLPLFNQSRAHKAGSVVPIRLQLLDASGMNVSSSSLVLTATGLRQQDSTASPLVVEDAGNANPDSAFRYDGTLQGYAFNLSTRNLAPGTWELRFRVGGGTREYAVTFDVR